MRPFRPRRTLTTLAVGFLLLDAVLFAIAGLFTPAAVCVLAAALVVGLWRRYCRTVAELADASREMKREAESIRELLETHRRN